MAEKKKFNQAGDTEERVTWNQAGTRKWKTTYTLLEVKPSWRKSKSNAVSDNNKNEKKTSKAKTKNTAKRKNTKPKIQKPAKRKTKKAAKPKRKSKDQLSLNLSS